MSDDSIVVIDVTTSYNYHEPIKTGKPLLMNRYQTVEISTQFCTGHNFLETELLVNGPEYLFDNIEGLSVAEDGYYTVNKHIKRDRHGAIVSVKYSLERFYPGKVMVRK